jgi:hypothetical protein
MNVSKQCRERHRSAKNKWCRMDSQNNPKVTRTEVDACCVSVMSNLCSNLAAEIAPVYDLQEQLVRSCLQQLTVVVRTNVYTVVLYLFYSSYFID